MRKFAAGIMTFMIVFLPLHAVAEEKRADVSQNEANAILSTDHPIDTQSEETISDFELPTTRGLSYEF